MPFALILPLLSAIVYVAGALWLKRAADGGANVWRITCACNWGSTITFLPLLLFPGPPIPWHLWWQPAIVSLLFLLGQILSFLAIRVGDVSVATPVLGVKIILVAFFTTFLIGEPVSGVLWTAAALSSAAIALLNQSGKHASGNIGLTILASGGGAASYALFDVLVQKWSPAWGSQRFLPVMMGIVAVLSLFLWRLRNAPASECPVEGPAYRRPLLAGAACLGVQSLMFISAVAIYGKATAANVLYSSRGLWSVVAVWTIGHWFGNREQQLGARVLRWRVCGAALMLAAIALVFGA